MSNDFKFCPKCGTERADGQKFCPNCGYSYENPKNNKPQKSGDSIVKRALSWAKSHLKIVICVAVAVVLVLVLAITIPVCIATKNNGTYYELSYSGELNKQSFIKISSGKWEDDDGESGTYKLDGDKIIFYVTLFGETEELCDGTIGNGVLSLNMGGGIKATYVSEKHKHSYGEWETSWEATCTTNGLKIRSCACGFIDSQETEKLPHSLSHMNFDDKNHWKICSECNQIYDKSEHVNNDGCSECGYKFFIYALSDDKTSYYVTGLIDKNATVANIPSIYNGLPVTSIGNSAFYKCSGLTSVTIGNSVTTIGEEAFYKCSGLTGITIPDSVTYIGYDAFSWCSGLTRITIPNSVTYIGGYAFSWCSRLTSINYNGTMAEWKSIRKGSGWDDNIGNYTVYCTDGEISK